MALVNVASLLLLFCSFTRTHEQQDACMVGTWPCPANAEYNATFKYALNLSSTEYLEAQEITLKVHMTSCPTVSTPGPKWYKLEAISQVTLTAVGTFLESHRRSEAYLCRNKTVTVFSTCDSNPLDLPRKYRWIAPVTAAGTICFRLTIQTDKDPNCHAVEECIEATVPPASGESLPTVKSPQELSDGNSSVSPQELSDGNSSVSPEIFDTSPTTDKPLSTSMKDSPVTTPPLLEVPQPQNGPSNRCSRINCTDAKPKLFCGSDGREYNSRCEKRLQECLTKTEITLDPGHCPTEPPPISCTAQQEEQSIWKPACTCNDRFKPIQCYNFPEWTCWCSSDDRFGSRVTARKEINCMDPEEPIEFDCLDL